MSFTIEKSQTSYRADANSDWPIFFQPWWLDIVCAHGWDALVARNINSEPVGFMPLPLSAKGKRILMPPFTPFLGLFRIQSGKTKATEESSYEKNLVTDFINELTLFDYYEQRWPRSFTNWLPFYWNGYTANTKYTYVINNLSDLEKIKIGFRKNIKSDISKAEKKIKVLSSDNIAAFYEVYQKTFNRQGLASNISFAFLDKLIMACISRNQGCLLFAQDDAQEIHAAAFMVWDDHSAYLIASGGDPKLRNSGATSLLYCEAIRVASTKTKAIDFSGSMVEQIEKFVRAFGPTQVPYFELQKTNSRTMLIKRALVQIANAITQKNSGKR